ncbi:MAG: TIM barrel protein [Armatimonadetes bacterium]|nr:TIM barrel protein [Armatimonadota bacterium]
MSDNTIQFSVFTKPWKMPIPELAKFVAGLGLHAIELPVRPGYPVNPNNMAKELPNAARILGEHGVKIASIAGPTDEAAMAACQSAGVPIIRICVNIDNKIGYMASEESLQREYDALVPLLEKHHVTLGIQNHCGACICNAMGLRHLLEKYHPKHIAAVWDCSHNALNGEEPEMALDIVWDKICMVNFKNAYWRRKSGPEALTVQWEVYWTSGRQGLADWARVAAELKRRHFHGTICLTAEYSDEPAVNRLIAEDLAYAKSLFA